MTLIHRKNCAGCLTIHSKHSSDKISTPPFQLSRELARAALTGLQLAPKNWIKSKQKVYILKNPTFIGFFGRTNVRTRFRFCEKSRLNAQAQMTL